MARLKPFSELSELSPQTLDVITSLGFTTATPVQEACIPLFCGHKDVAVDACTGSGKTLAFVVPVVEKLRRLEEPLKLHQVGAIIVSPTRELARQIHTVAEPFINSVRGLTCGLFVGGTDTTADVSTFKERGCHVMIGTPGRIEDVMKRCTQLDVRKLEVLVLDEADRLLDMGFQRQLDAIMSRLPKQRRTGLFSATQTEAVEALARAGLRNPVRINVAVTAKRGPSSSGSPGTSADPQKTPQGLSIRYVTCEADEKLPQLVSFLGAHSADKIIVYFLTCACVELFATLLRRIQQGEGGEALRGLHLAPLHGKMTQKAREAALAVFSKQPAGCLLCTDVAARGLDIPDVSWIVQFDPPQDPDTFLHRVGRTARAGRSGDALVYLMPHEAIYVHFLRRKQVPLLEADKLEVDAGLAGRARREAEADREVMEKAVRAFVSYVRGYQEHTLKFIFRLPELDFGRLATTMGVLRLPGMSELRKAKGVSEFVPSDVDPDTVKFKDKHRERQRQKDLKRKAEEAAAGGGNAGKRPHKGPGGKRPKPAAQDTKKLPSAKRQKLAGREDVEDFANDYSLLKKLKRGKISEQEFELAAGMYPEEPPAAAKDKQQAHQQQPSLKKKHGKRKTASGADKREPQLAMGGDVSTAATGQPTAVKDASAVGGVPRPVTWSAGRLSNTGKGKRHPHKAMDHKAANSGTRKAQTKKH